MDVSNQYNFLKDLSNLENRVSPNPRIRGTVYLGDRLYSFSTISISYILNSSYNKTARIIPQ